MIELIRHALEYLKNTGESVTVEQFDDDHDPLGPVLRVQLVPRYMRVVDGVLKLTVEGKTALFDGCEYTIEDVAPRYVVLRDNNRPGTQSLTNAAERICMQMHERFPGRRVFYIDTLGNFDEMRHDRGRFVGFVPGSRASDIDIL